MLYDIILSKPSILFHVTCGLVTVTVTASVTNFIQLVSPQPVDCYSTRVWTDFRVRVSGQK